MTPLYFKARSRGDFSDATGQKLYEAALFGRTATVEELLLAPSYDGGADPDYCTSTGQTSSYAAALRGNIKELRLLVSAGADLSLAAEDGVNPCLAAVQVVSTVTTPLHTATDCLCVCVCVCVRARARARVCLCIVNLDRCICSS